MEPADQNIENNMKYVIVSFSGRADELLSILSVEGKLAANFSLPEPDLA